MIVYGLWGVIMMYNSCSQQLCDLVVDLKKNSLNI